MLLCVRISVTSQAQLATNTSSYFCCIWHCRNSFFTHASSYCLILHLYCDVKLSLPSLYMPLLNIWGHITTVPACSSGTLTNVLPHRNAMPQTQDMTPHPVTVYRHKADLSMYYPLRWDVTLEYITTHFNVLGKTRSGNPSPTLHTNQRTFNLMMLIWW